MSTETKFLLDTLTKNLTLMVMEDFGYTIPEAMSVVYNSQLYEKILDTLLPETKIKIVENPDDGMPAEEFVE